MKTLEEFIAEKYYGWTVQENVAREVAAEILRVCEENAVQKGFYKWVRLDKLKKFINSTNTEGGE